MTWYERAVIKVEELIAMFANKPIVLSMLPSN